MGINVLSLFDGMSCGQIALQRAGIEVDNYFASEIDKYAIQVTKKNFPNTIHLGSVLEVHGKDLPKIDLLIGGSPCTGFSMAGKQLNFKDPQSKLFFEYVRILEEVKPTNFLLENVRMKKEYQDKISEFIGAQPVMIDSALMSAQHRKRLYWANFQITQPEDKHIMLPSVLETGVVDRDKSYCIDASYFKGGSKGIDLYLKKARRQVVFTERRTDEAKRIRREFMELYGRDFSPRRAKEMVQRTDGKANCLTASLSYKEHSLIDESLFFRHLTPIECERLQTVDDNYTDGVSNTQRYKMLGNGWTIDVIAHILGCIGNVSSFNRLFKTKE